MCGWMGMGRAVVGAGVVRAALGLVGVGVLAVVEEAGTCMKQTSGGSGMGVSLRGGCRGCREQRCTYWVLTVEDETEAIDLVFVQRIVVEDSDVHLPFFEVVCFDDVNARRKFLFGLLRCQLCTFFSVFLSSPSSDLASTRHCGTRCVDWAGICGIPSAIPIWVSVWA